MISYEDAIDEMFGIFNEMWALSTVSIVGYIPEIRWQGIENPENPDLATYWVRVSQQTVKEEQSTFREGSKGKRFTTNGLIFVQIFCPKSDSLSMINGRKLAIVSRNSFRANSDNIWFRKSRINEVPPETNWNIFNVVAEYEYDEIA